MAKPKAGEEGWDEYKAKANARRRRRREDPDYVAKEYARQQASKARLKARREAEKQNGQGK